jgi:hypothetical protein
MANFYLNGGGLLTGEKFIDTADLLTKIKNHLVNSGFTLVLDDIATNSILKVKGITTVNSHECWINFSVIEGSIIDEKILEIRGDLDGLEATLSGTFQCPYIEDADNFMWMAANNDSGGIVIKSFNGVFSAVGFGFPERRLETDEFSWGLFRPFYRFDSSYYTVAKGAHANDNWHTLDSDFSSASSITGRFGVGPVNGTFDFLTSQVIDAALGYTSSNSSSFRAYNGQINKVTGEPFITRRFVLEGLNSTTAYTPQGTNVATQLYQRGPFQHFYNGGGSLPAGTQLTTPSNGDVYISTGGPGWQIMKIFEGSGGTPSTPLPVVFRSGNSPDYLGQNFNTEGDVLSEIKNTLTSAGWTATIDNIAGNDLQMRGSYIRDDNVTIDYCYFNFSTSVDNSRTNGRFLNIQGDLDGTKSIVSPILNMGFIHTADNRSWITANSQAAAITLRSFDTTQNGSGNGGFIGVHLGFVGERRLKDDDSTAIYMGYINSSYTSAYVAKDFSTNNNWYEQYRYYTSSAASFQFMPLQTVMDRWTTLAKPRDGLLNGANYNAAYAANYGALNRLTSNAELDFFCYIEGTVGINYPSSSSDLPPQLGLRGIIQFVAVGAGSSLPGEQITTNTGAVFLSTGGPQWQAQRIQ